MASALPSPHPLQYSFTLSPSPLPMATTGSTSTDRDSSTTFSIFPHDIRRLQLSSNSDSSINSLAYNANSLFAEAAAGSGSRFGTSSSATTLSMDPQSTGCPIAEMEQYVLEFVNCMLVEEDKCSDTSRPCLLDHDDDSAAFGLYQNIFKDLVDIVSGHPPPGSIAHNLVHNEPNYLEQDRLFAMDGDLRQKPGEDEEVSEIFEREMDALGSGSTTSDEIDACHDEDLQRGSDFAAQYFRREDESTSSGEYSPVEFGAWVEQVLSSATLVNGDEESLNYLLPTAADSSTDSGTATSHDVQRPSPEAAQRYDARSTDVEARLEQLQTPLRERRIEAEGDYVPAAKATVPMMLMMQHKQKLEMEQRDFSFKDEMGEVIQAAYENLYAPAAASEVDGRKKNGSGGSSRRRPGANKRKGSASISAPGYFDLEELLISCGQAVSRSDSRKAREILQELKRQGTSAQGRSCLHRMAFYFCRALEARLDGSGAALYAAEVEASRSTITASDTIRAWLRMFDSWHYIKIAHFFANHSFMAVSEHRLRLHVVDYGLSYGSQWAYLIKALSRRAGGPPLLIVTGIQNESSQNPSATEHSRPLAETGRRLSEFAAACNVPFRFHGVASSRWEDLDAESLGIELDRRSETALVVNVIKHLQFIPDETVQEQLYGDLLLPRTNHDTMSPRQKLLCRIRSLRPDLFVTGVSNAGFNVPTFLTRFKEALQHFSSMFDMMEVTTEESPERQLMERLFRRSILNVVACEGADRVLRPETYRQWERRLHRAGWEQFPVPAGVLRRSMEYVRDRYHRDCTVMEDHSSPWLLMGWRGRTYMAMATWKPR